MPAQAQQAPLPHPVYPSRVGITRYTPRGGAVNDFSLLARKKKKTDTDVFRRENLSDRENCSAGYTQYVPSRGPDGIGVARGVSHTQRRPRRWRGETM